LFTAVENRDPETVEFLLRNGASSTVLDNEKKTPIAIAREQLTTVQTNALKTVHTPEGVERVLSGFSYQRDVRPPRPFTLKARPLFEGGSLLQFEGEVGIGLDGRQFVDVPGATWLFESNATKFVVGDNEFTTLVPGATIQFKEDVVELKGLKYENLAITRCRRILDMIESSRQQSK